MELKERGAQGYNVVVKVRGCEDSGEGNGEREMSANRAGVTSKASFVALDSLRAPISHSTPCWSPGTPISYSTPSWSLSVFVSYSPHCWSLGALDQLVMGLVAIATMGFIMCGVEAAQKATATPMSTSARKLEAPFFAYRIEMGECIKHVARQGRTWSSGVIGIPPESVAHPTEPQSPLRKHLSREEAAAGAA